MYDVCSKESFQHIPTWMNEARRHIEPHKAVFILVGCKRDRTELEAKKNREVSEDEARAFAHFHNLPFVETSSKTGLNVEDAFAILTQVVYDKIETGEYKVNGDWDGIKRGFYGNMGGNGRRPLSGRGSGRRLNNNHSSNHRIVSSNGSIVNLVEGQPERKLCC